MFLATVLKNKLRKRHVVRMLRRIIIKILSWNINTFIETASLTVATIHPFNDQDISQTAITCSKLTRETLGQGVKYVHSGVFIVNFEHISHLVLVFFIDNFEQVNAGWVGYEV